MKTISVIISTFNSSALIEKCIESVRNNYSNKFTIKLVLIDNNSTDSSANIISEYQNENCVVVKNQENLGFAKGVNQGIDLADKHFSSDYYLLLNPDATLQEDAISELYRFSSKKNNVICSPIIINPDTKSYWFCGAKIGWIRQKTIHLTSPKSESVSYKTDVLSGCCVLISKSIAKRIGLFDERFYLYYEDADYCVRASQKSIGCYVVPISICHHLESQSSVGSIKCQHLVKSGLLFFNKHLPWFMRPIFWIIYFSRLGYHKYISHKECVLTGMHNFYKEKNLPKTDNSI